MENAGKLGSDAKKKLAAATAASDNVVATPRSANNNKVGGSDLPPYQQQPQQASIKQPQSQDIEMRDIVSVIPSPTTSAKQRAAGGKVAAEEAFMNKSTSFTSPTKTTAKVYSKLPSNAWENNAKTSSLPSPRK